MTSVLGYDIGDWGFDLPDIGWGDWFPDEETPSWDQFRPSTTSPVTSPTLPDVNDGGSIFTDRRILGPLLETTVGLGGMIFGNNAKKDQLEAAKEQAKMEAIYGLEMEKLKQKYATPKGGGGGKGGGSGADRRGQLLNAYGQYIQGVSALNQRNEESLRGLGNSISGSYLAGRR